MIEESLDKKVRNLQADKIKKTGSNVSFSNMIDTVLRKGLK